MTTSITISRRAAGGPWLAVALAAVLGAGLFGASAPVAAQALRLDPGSLHQVSDRDRERREWQREQRRREARREQERRERERDRYHDRYDNRGMDRGYNGIPRGTGELGGVGDWDRRDSPRDPWRRDNGMGPRMGDGG